MKNYTSTVPVSTTIGRVESILARAGRGGMRDYRGQEKNLGTGMLGKKHSDETKRKISEAHRGMRASTETRAKMSRVRKGTQMGPDHPNWKGGEWVNKEGRVYAYSPNHPHANNKGYVFRSRLVMEEMLGRYLKPEEVVHHRNEITSDDRPENLQLFPSHGAHTAFHNTGKDRKGQGRKMLGTGGEESKP